MSKRTGSGSGTARRGWWLWLRVAGPVILTVWVVLLAEVTGTWSSLTASDTNSSNDWTVAAPPVPAKVESVTGTWSSGTTFATGAFGSNTTDNDLEVLIEANEYGGGTPPTVSSISGGGVTTWSKAVAETEPASNVNIDSEIWYGIVTSAVTTAVTVHLSGTPGAGSGNYSSVTEFSGTATSSPLDGTPATNGSTSSVGSSGWTVPGSGSMTETSGDLLITASTWSTADSSTPTATGSHITVAGYSAVSWPQGSQYIGYGFYAISNSTTETATWASTGDVTFGSVLAAFLA